MAKNKSKRKKKPNNSKPKSIKPENYIRKYARSLPFSKCYISETWKESGMASIVVSRKMAGGEYAMGFYLVDIFCLGVKNTGVKTNMDQFEFQEFVERIEYGLDDDKLIPCEPILAQNIIYGAVEYAEDLGFSPHKDFKHSEYMLDDVEDIDYLDIEFGVEGIPHFIVGPFDNMDRIVKKLEMAVGPDNFNISIPNEYFEREGYS